MRTHPIFHTLFSASLLCLLLSSCADGLEEVQPLEPSALLQASGGSSRDNGAEINFVPFGPVTAMIAYCHGENIEFSGEIANLTKTTVDKQGNIHYTRVFRAKNLKGKGKIGDTYTGTTYLVQGGAEMFSIHSDEGDGLTLDESRIYIHSGTLVFVNQEDGSRVVARHVIRKVPGQGIMENEWKCQGN